MSARATCAASPVVTPIADATGKVWQKADLLQPSAIVGLFVMLPFAVASFVALWLREERKP